MIARSASGFHCVITQVIYNDENENNNLQYTVPDIIKFTYYHCTSIDYSVLCE